MAEDGKAASFEDETQNPIARLSHAELMDLRHAFDLFDTEKSGKIPIQRLKDVLEEIKVDDETIGTCDQKSASNWKRLVSKVSSLSSNDTLNFDDFVKLIVEPDPKDTRSDMRRVFDLFDRNGKGFIDVEDLRAVSVELGESMTDDELLEMLKRGSLSCQVSYNEFESIMTKKLFS